MGGKFCGQVPISQSQIKCDDATLGSPVVNHQKTEDNLEKVNPQQHQENFGNTDELIKQNSKKKHPDDESTAEGPVAPISPAPRITPIPSLPQRRVKTQPQQQTKLLMIHHDASPPSFQKASINQIEEMLNTKIKYVQEPLELPSQIDNQPFEERNDCFLIELQRLPRKGNNMPENWVYIGQWFQGYPHGIGKIYHKDFIYEGYIHYGIPHVMGRYMTEEDIYEGEISLNIRQGLGSIVTRSQYYFQGSWRKNSRQGLGFEIHKNGMVFQGKYESNTVVQGLLCLPKANAKKKLNCISNQDYLELCKKHWKECYRGQFQDRKFNGKGTYIWSDQRKYEGDWKDGKMHGFGKFMWPNGKSYEGDYEDGRKNGYGVFKGSDKEYSGNWLNGKPHGKGTISRGNKTQQKLFYKGKIVNNNMNSDDTISMLTQCEEQYPDEAQTSLQIPGC